MKFIMPRSLRYSFLRIALPLFLVAVMSAGTLSRPGLGTVLDYYLALPEAYFMCETTPNVTREYREKQIVRKNISSGYMEAKSEGHPMQVALFTDNKLNVSCVVLSITCGAGCMCNRFAILQAGEKMELTDVTEKIFPNEKEIFRAAGKNRDYSLEYKLPEYGTVIKVVDSMTGKALCNIHWSGGRFVIR